MEAKELRIGNYIQFNDTPIANGVYSVMAIKDDLIVAENGGAAYLNEVEPIPITVEWLHRFGFEKVSYYRLGLTLSGFIGLTSNSIDEKELIVSLSGDSHCRDYGFDVKYVHQLQNLYFSLTGEDI